MSTKSTKSSKGGNGRGKRSEKSSEGGFGTGTGSPESSKGGSGSYDAKSCESSMGIYGRGKDRGDRSSTKSVPNKSTGSAESSKSGSRVANFSIGRSDGDCECKSGKDGSYQSGYNVHAEYGVGCDANANSRKGGNDGGCGAKKSGIDGGASDLDDAKSSTRVGEYDVVNTKPSKGRYDGRRSAIDTGRRTSDANTNQDCLFVKHPNGVTYSLAYSQHMTVQDIIHKVSQQSSISLDDSEFYLTMNNHKALYRQTGTLAEYGIPRNQTLVIQLRAAGGAGGSKVSLSFDRYFIAYTNI